jgi:DNA polymerase-3 subunit epsilon
MELSNDLVTLDLETTGTWVERDKIIEIGMVKCAKDGTITHYEQKVNPGMKIPATVVELTGIKQEDVQDAPKFHEVAQEVLDFIGEADLAGFNCERFDLPMLEREMHEAGVQFEWQKHTIYDAQKIYHLNEKRDLTAAYKFYCDKDLSNAHSAMADATATFEILKGQLERYGKDDKMVQLQEYNYKTLADFFDNSRRFRWWNGKLYPMFGKYAKRYSLQELCKKDSKYLEWILNADFSDEIKTLVQNALHGEFPIPPDDQKKLQESES